MSDEPEIPQLFNPRPLSEAIPPKRESELTSFQEEMDKIAPVKIKPYVGADGKTWHGWYSADPATPYALTVEVSGDADRDAWASAWTHRRLRWAMVSMRFFQDRAEELDWPTVVRNYLVPVLTMQDPRFAKHLTTFLESYDDGLAKQ